MNKKLNSSAVYHLHSATTCAMGKPVSSTDRSMDCVPL